MYSCKLIIFSFNLSLLSKAGYNITVKAFNMGKTAWLIWLFILLLGSLWVVLETDYFDAKPTMKNRVETALYLDETQPLDLRVADLLSRMTLAEKIGQMTLVEKKS